MNAYTKCSVTVDKNLEVTDYIIHTPLKTSLNNNFPTKMQDIRLLHEIMIYVLSVFQSKIPIHSKQITEVTKELFENLKTNLLIVEMLLIYSFTKYTY